ncbi:MAG: hypothetical protein ACK4TA_00255 [Saprospiraceae bacterium]
MKKEQRYYTPEEYFHLLEESDVKEVLHLHSLKIDIPLQALYAKTEGLI